LPEETSGEVQAAMARREKSLAAVIGV